MISCLLHAPYWGPGLQPSHVPWAGIKPATFCSQAHAQSTEPHQPRLLILFKWKKIRINQCLHYEMPLVLMTTTLFSFPITIKTCTQHTECPPEPCLNQLDWLGISFKVFMTLWFRRAINFIYLICAAFSKSHLKYSIFVFSSSKLNASIRPVS